MRRIRVIRDLPALLLLLARRSLWVARHAGIFRNVFAFGSPKTSTLPPADPNYPESMIRVLGDELIEEATVQGFYGEVVEAAKPYGGVEGYVRHELEVVSSRK